MNITVQKPTPLLLYFAAYLLTADCLRHTVQMVGVETIWELHTEKLFVVLIALRSGTIDIARTFVASNTYCQTWIINLLSPIINEVPLLTPLLSLMLTSAPLSARYNTV